jgi:amino acid adenylation domain-containing protein
MRDLARLSTNLPPAQQAIRAKCFHPSGAFIAFPQEELEQSLADRFEKIVRLYPHRLAVKTRSHVLTYAALNHAVNRLAHAILAQQGAGEQPVAVLLEHGVAVITALLALWKTGKIYVPLDPTLPHARTNAILEDTRPGLLVTNTLNCSYAARMHQGCHIMNIDELEVNASMVDPGVSISPDNRAYILYTSGSAGQPKGVVQNHRNLLHQIKRETNGLHICVDDRLTLLRSCSAIGGVRVVLSALLNGAAVYPWHVAQAGQAEFANFLCQEDITIYDSAATPFRHFVGSLTGKEHFPALRLVRISSEPVYKSDVELYHKHFAPDCIFVNSLGLTETAGSIRHYFIDQETQVTGNPVPVGYTVEDMEILLLDDHGQQVDCQSVGEIAVRSRYLSPGYWRRPALTQAKFRFDPQSEDVRTYLTGDVGRLLPDGCLLHLGRKDLQVKIRGYRVDIAEIEQALLALDSITEAVVVAREDRPAELSLVAYVVTSQQPSPTVSSFRQALAATLPAYMIPAAFVVLDTMPVTPTGKVDRRALPAPGHARPAMAAEFVPPRSELERSLVHIWQEVLHIEQVGIHDNFFDLGGHSLLATRVVDRIREALHVDVSIHSLFEATTVAELAVLVKEHWVASVPPTDLSSLVAELEALSDREAHRALGQETDLA